MMRVVADLNRKAMMTRASVTDTKGWVVVCAGARDSYQAALALHQAGLLKTLVTDLYMPLDKVIPAAACRLLPSSIFSKLERRFRDGLPSSLVDSHPGYAIRNWLRPHDWIHRVDGLGRRAGSRAATERYSVLSYSHVATAAFVRVPELPKVLMQIQPHPAAVKTALASDSFLPEFPHEMRNELSWPAEVFQKFAREPLLADLCIAPSKYTRETLTQNGANSDRVAVIPYGVDVDFFTPAQISSDTFTVLFVGQLSRQKGLHYLLEASRRLRLANAELRIVGELPSNRRALRAYAVEATFLGTLDWTALRNEYRRADILCLPSLSEGFGLVVLEAMACGTPVLTTRTSGAADLICESKNGFVITAADLDSLMTKLEWASANREFLRDMRTAARETAEQYPWVRFRNALVNTLQSTTITR